MSAIADRARRLAPGASGAGGWGGVSRRRSYWILAVLCAGVGLVIAAVTSLYAAGPELAKGVGASQTQLTWISDAYTLVMAGLLLPAGALGDRYGRRSVMVAGLVVFVAASVALEFVDTPAGLITGRAVLGVGAALILPSTLSLITSTFPPEFRETAVGIWTAAFSMAGVIGGLSAAILLEHFDWHSAFWSVLAGGVIVLGMSLTLPDSRDEDPPRLDPPGSLAISVSVFAFVFAFIDSGIDGWGSAPIILALLVGVLAAVAFVVIELRTDGGILDVRLFAVRPFGVSAFTVMMCFASVYGLFFLIMQYEQFVLGRSALSATVPMASMGFTVIPIAVIAGWVTRTFGLRVVVSLGCLLQAAAFAVLHQAGMHTSYTVLFGTTLVIGAGLGLNMAPCTAAIITSVSEAKQGVAASVNHATREIGTALGVALFGGLLTGVYASHIHRASAHLPAAARAISRESIAGALAVAHQTAQHAHTAARALTHAHPFGRHHVHLVAIGHAHAHALAQIHAQARYAATLALAAREAYVAATRHTSLVMIFVMAAAAVIAAIWAPSKRQAALLPARDPAPAATGTGEVTGVPTTGHAPPTPRGSSGTALDQWEGAGIDVSSWRDRPAAGSPGPDPPVSRTVDEMPAHRRRTGVLSFGGRGPVLLALALGNVMIGIDSSVVSIANATLGRDLHANLAGLQWVTNAYLLPLCALMLTGGRLADLVGRKAVYMTGIIMFAAASAGCAASSSVAMLVLFRILQGTGGALMMPGSLAIVRASFPAAELERAITIWGATSTLGLIAGPIIGGLLVQHISWQAVFLINLPIAAIALPLTYLRASETRDDTTPPGLDLKGSALAALGLFLLVYGLIKVQSWGWGDGRTITLTVLGVLLLIDFALEELESPNPMLPMGLFRNQAITAGAIATVAIYFALFGVIFFWTLYLQRIHGDTPVLSGIHLLPLSIAFTTTAAIVGTAGRFIHPRVTMTGGLIVLATGLLLLANITATSSIADLTLPLAIIGIGIGMSAMTGVQVMTGNAPVRYAAIASAVMTTLVQLGGILGTTILGSVLDTHATHQLTLTLAQLPIHHHPLGLTTAHQLAANATTAIAQGTTTHLPGIPHHLIRPLIHAGTTAFVSGLQTATRIGAITALAAAPIGLLVRRGENPAGLHLG